VLHKSTENKNFDRQLPALHLRFPHARHRKYTVSNVLASASIKQWTPQTNGYRLTCRSILRVDYLTCKSVRGSALLLLTCCAKRDSQGCLAVHRYLTAVKVFRTTSIWRHWPVILIHSEAEQTYSSAKTPISTFSEIKFSTTEAYRSQVASALYSFKRPD